MPPVWGVSTRFGACSSGLSAGSGSSQNTSSAAPASFPLSSARSSAASSTSRPRAVLTKNEPSRMSPKARSSIIRSVSGTNRLWSETTCDRASSSSNVA